MEALKEFKEGRVHVLVASDVAARGLDIKGVKTVVVFEVSKDIDTHVHRVGRTGRAGREGSREWAWGRVGWIRVRFFGGM